MEMCINITLESVIVFLFWYYFIGFLSMTLAVLYNMRSKKLRDYNKKRWNENKQREIVVYVSGFIFVVTFWLFFLFMFIMNNFEKKGACHE